MKGQRGKRFFDPWMSGMAVFLFLGLMTDGVLTEARELPIPATIQELLSRSEQFDGRRVFVSGRVRAMKIDTGRRGSEYLEMVLEEAVPEAVNGLSLQVFSMTIPRVGAGHRVSVQGIYHHGGRYGGSPHDDFIEADAIIREK